MAQHLTIKQEPQLRPICSNYGTVRHVVKSREGSYSKQEPESLRQIFKDNFISKNKGVKHKL